MDNENKIIKVDFSDGKPEKPVWEGLYQWDIGTKLEIHGLELEEDTQVHFSLEEYSGEAPRMPGVYSDGVLTVGIPCFISEGEEERCYCYNDGYKAFAWIYIVRENYEETRKKIALHYKKRPKPADYISPGDTQLVLDVRGELNSKVSKTGHAPNKYLGTDENGNVVEKDAPTGTTNVVKYIEQTITDDQKKQARQNIGAASSEDLGRLSDTKLDKTGITLATHTDGLIYLFVDGKPVGIGLDLSSGGTVEPDVPDEPIIPVQPTDIMSNYKYLGATTYSPGTYTAWCPTSLIYDETRDVYAHFMHTQNTHYMTPNCAELWFNTINPNTLEHSEPKIIARTAEVNSGTFASKGALGQCVKDGIYYAFGNSEVGFFKSNDGGTTWTQETYEIAPDVGPWGCYVLSNGRMIMGSDAQNHKVYYSDDNGKNWITVQSENFNEPTFIEFPNGELMAICRENKDSANNIKPPWMHISKDYGETWTQSVAMETVGYMGNNNCNAYVHDNYVELFVGSRGFTNSPQYDGVTYEIRQYVMDLNKGAVDEFEYVNTVYKCLPDDNPQGLIGEVGQDDFSSPCIAIKDKSHALLMFYAPSRYGVTHHLIAVGNVPVDDFAIPSIIPKSYNTSQTFSGTEKEEFTICKSYGVTQQAYSPYYPLLNSGYLKIDDIEDGGFLHMILRSNGLGDLNGTTWTVLPLVNVEDRKIKSGSMHTGIIRSPMPNGTTSIPVFNAKKMSKTYARGEHLHLYAFIKDGKWWIYDEGTWYRSDAGNCDISNINYNNDRDSFSIIPNKYEELTTYKAVSGLFGYRQVVTFEYDKKVS